MLELRDRAEDAEAKLARVRHYVWNLHCNDPHNFQYGEILALLDEEGGMR